jgi:DNA-binding response OmpR family regulator
LPKLLLVDDDENLLNTVQDWFKAQNFEVDIVSNGREGLERLKFYKYDLVILDWGMPDMTGIDVCRAYRTEGGETPVLMLTGQDKIEHKETGFSAGADDYLTKPFSLRELAARVRALLRRPSTYTSEKLQVGTICIDSGARKVVRSGKDIDLAPREFSLLEFLMRHADQVFSDEAILDRVWPSSSDASSETLRTCIKKLRRKIDLEGQPSIIKNVAGVGYRFDSEQA